MAPEQPDFFEELKRRHMWRIAVAYTVAGWLLVQIATTVFPIFHMPDWTAQLVVLLVVLGFPVVVILAWVYEITPEGLRRTAPADSPEARPEYANRQIGRKLNTVIISILVLAVALLGWRLLVLHRVENASQSGTRVATQAQTLDRPIATTAALPASVAFHPSADTLVVLPFANPGGDPKQQYFSDGITEELTNALGQNTGLRVIAWDTASRYRDNKQPATEIGKALDVANVLTGKILRQGNEVRVIVELVSATTGYQTWSSHYDDSLANIFQVQDKISAAIANALKVKFAATHSTATVDPEAYDLVLKARALMQKAHTAVPFEQARKLLEHAVALAPDYADAHATLARTWFELSQFSTLPLTDTLAKAREEANRALALDSRNVAALVELGNVEASEGKVADAKAKYKRALDIDPSNATAHLDYGTVLPLQEYAVQEREAVRIDPDNATAQNNLATNYMDLGEYAAALAPAQALAKLSPHSADSALLLAQVHSLLRQDEEAVKAFDQVQPDTELGKVLAAAGRQVYQSVLDAKQHTQALIAVNALRKRPDLDPFSFFDVIQLYLALGENDTALALLPQACAAVSVACNDLSVHPMWLPLRQKPEFKALVKKYDTTSRPSASTP